MVILFFIQSTSAADPPCVSQKMDDKRKLDNATGKWDLQKGMESKGNIKC
jgi:hypothetical protein